MQVHETRKGQSSAGNPIRESVIVSLLSQNHRIFEEAVMSLFVFPRPNEADMMSTNSTHIQKEAYFGCEGDYTQKKTQQIPWLGLVQRAT